MLVHLNISSSRQPLDVLDIGYLTNSGGLYSNANSFLAQRHAPFGDFRSWNRVVGRVFWRIIPPCQQGYSSSLARGAPLIRPLRPFCLTSLPADVARDGNNPGAMTKPESDTMKHPICDRRERLMVLSWLIFKLSLLRTPSPHGRFLLSTALPSQTRTLFVFTLS